MTDKQILAALKRSWLDGRLVYSLDNWNNLRPFFCHKVHPWVLPHIAGGNSNIGWFSLTGKTSIYHIESCWYCRKHNDGIYIAACPLTWKEL